MNIRGIFLIILLASASALLFPVFSQDTEVALIPNESSTVIVRVDRPTMWLNANFEGDILMNISYYHGARNETEMIVTNEIFSENYSIDDLQTGYYTIVLLANQLGKVVITGSGYYLTPLVIFFVFLLPNIYFLYKKLDED